jgi:hypothetical protein
MYRQKYLKYKKKYLDLKRYLGGEGEEKKTCNDDVNLDNILTFITILGMKYWEYEENAMSIDKENFNNTLLNILKKNISYIFCIDKIKDKIKNYTIDNKFKINFLYSNFIDTTDIYNKCHREQNQCINDKNEINKYNNFFSQILNNINEEKLESLNIDIKDDYKIKLEKMEPISNEIYQLLTDKKDETKHKNIIKYLLLCCYNIYKHNLILANMKSEQTQSNKSWWQNILPSF